MSTIFGKWLFSKAPIAEESSSGPSLGTPKSPSPPHSEVVPRVPRRDAVRPAPWWRARWGCEPGATSLDLEWAWNISPASIKQINVSPMIFLKTMNLRMFKISEVMKTLLKHEEWINEDSSVRTDLFLIYCNQKNVMFVKIGISTIRTVKTLVVERSASDRFKVMWGWSSHSFFWG